MGEILDLAQKIDDDAHRWSNQDRVRIEIDLTGAEYALLQTALRNAAVAFAARPDREGWQEILLECREFMADLEGGAEVNDRSREHAKELKDRADVALGICEQEANR